MSRSRLSVRLLLSIVFLNAILSVLSQNVFAHARWIIADDKVTSLVTARPGDLKTAPCGGKARTNTPKVLKKGDTVTLKFRETIGHPGHFIISFSPAADEDFDKNILLDNIVRGVGVVDDKNNIYSREITLPDVECTDCALQLIQVMTDRNPPTNYYSCADIQLTATGAPPPVGGDVTPPSDISNLSIVPGDTQATLSWTNPVADFFQVLILQDTQSISTGPTVAINYNVNEMIGSSKVIYLGNGTSHIAQGLINGDTYFYKLFAYDTRPNYASGAEISVDLAANPVNSPPVLSIIAEQSQTVTTSIRSDAGDVIVQASVNDPNPSDSHRYDWTSTDSRLVDLETVDDVFTFNPSGLVPGTYSLEVTVTDDGTPNMTAQASLAVDVVIAVDNGAIATGGGGGSLNGFSLLLLGLIFGLRRLVLKYD